MRDFWGFLQQQEARLHNDFFGVTSEKELENVRRKWLDPGGILQHIQDDPHFSGAKPNAQKIFQEIMRNEIELVSGHWKEIWNLEDRS